MFVKACSNPQIPIKTPRFVKKARRFQKKRDQQMKTIVDDIANIASKEVERTRDLFNDFMDSPEDNPIKTNTITEIIEE